MIVTPYDSSGYNFQSGSSSLQFLIAAYVFGFVFGVDTFLPGVDEEGNPILDNYANIIYVRGLSYQSSFAYKNDEEYQTYQLTVSKELFLPANSLIVPITFCEKLEEGSSGQKAMYHQIETKIKRV